MTHAEAIELIRQGGNTVNLLIKRNNHLPGIFGKFKIFSFLFKTFISQKEKKN